MDGQGVSGKGQTRVYSVCLFHGIHRAESVMVMQHSLGDGRMFPAIIWMGPCPNWCAARMVRLPDDTPDDCD